MTSGVLRFLPANASEAGDASRDCGSSPLEAALAFHERPPAAMSIEVAYTADLKEEGPAL